MLNRVARLTETPCLLGLVTRLGGIAFYHVNSLCRAILAGQGEINQENMAAWGVQFFFCSHHLSVLSAEQNHSQSEEINIIEFQTEFKRIS